jgi:membrane-bound metal-dependent hydrolase YbcI (DUF457 family)
MYIGHVGAALAGKRARTSIGLLVLLIATYAPDWVDTGLCVANSYNEQAMLSHSIPAVAVLALLGFALYLGATRDRTGAAIVAAVVISHMFFDWITGYKPTWPGGPMIGLRLYGHPLWDFAVEAVVLVIGVALYAPTLPRVRRSWSGAAMMLTVLVLMQLTVDLGRIWMKSLSKC